jgi:hypothetical protein
VARRVGGAFVGIVSKIFAKGEHMRKSISLVLVVVLSLLVVALLPGCGGDTKQAQEYMQNGDKLVERLQTEANTWQADVSASMTNVADPAAFQSAIEKAKASANDLSKTAGEAKAEFEKILELEGVEDYAKYAELQIEALDKFQELITKTNSFFDQMAAMVSSGDVSGLTAAQEQYTTEVTTLGEEINKLDDEAQQLKSDKDL